MPEKYQYKISLSFFNKENYEEYKGTINANNREEAIGLLTKQYDSPQADAIIINIKKEVPNND